MITAISHTSKRLLQRGVLGSAIRKGRSAFGNATRGITSHSQLPEETSMVYEMCRKFADEELAPNASQWDQKHEFPTTTIAALSELGFNIYTFKNEAATKYDRAGMEIRWFYEE